MSSVSLAGRLEDLGLNDILQILSLSRKSGLLRLGHGEEALELYIRGGQVVAARPHPSIGTLHAFLTQRGLLNGERETAFREVLRNKAFRVEPWASFWARVFGIPVEEAQRWAQEYVVWLVSRAASWEEGDFSFELQLDDVQLQKVRQIPAFPSVEEGLSAQFLAMESARLQDESSVAAPEAELGDQTITGVVPEPEVPQGGVEHLLVVEDKPETARALAQALRERGYPHVAVAHGVDEALQVIERSEERGWTVVSDLVMPKRDHSGVLGGLEVAQELHGNPKVERIFLCSDLLNPAIETQGLEAGAEGLISKPGRQQWKRDPEAALATFAEAIVAAIGPPAQPEPESGTETSPFDAIEVDIDLDDPLAGLLSETNLPLPTPRTDSGITILRRMLDELLSPDAEAEVTLLILRFAADMFQRAVLFAVMGETLHGLGQVGLTREDADQVVRALRIPLGRETIFDAVLRERRAIVGRPEGNPVLAHLFAKLGGPEPFEFVVAPVLAGDRIVAMLYADQVPTQSPVRNLETLEVFLGQAGLALERAYLRKRLEAITREKEGRDRN